MSAGPSVRSRRHQRGQSLVEFVIVAPVFLFLVLSILQMVLLYRAKTTLDYAVLEAARAGAVSGIDTAKMQRGLQRGLLPLYAHAPTQAGVAAAMQRAGGDIAAGKARLHVVNPTRRAWHQYSEKQHDNRLALPNDSLAFRSTAVDPRRGPKSHVSVQDANLLKLRVEYDYPLVVPFVDRVLRGGSLLVRGGADAPVHRAAGDRHYRLSIAAYAIVRMQSPVHDHRVLPP